MWSLAGELASRPGCGPVNVGRRGSTGLRPLTHFPPASPERTCHSAALWHHNPSRPTSNLRPNMGRRTGRARGKPTDGRGKVVRCSRLQPSPAAKAFPAPGDAMCVCVWNGKPCWTLHECGNVGPLWRTTNTLNTSWCDYWRIALKKIAPSVTEITLIFRIFFIFYC